VAETEGCARLIERPLELGAAVGQHPLDRPARRAEEREEDRAQEGRGGLRTERRQDGGEPVGAGRIAGRDLSDLADPLEVADIERVQAHQLAGLVRGHMARGPNASPATGRGAFAR
jgi:hypothetical protein